MLEKHPNDEAVSVRAQRALRMVQETIKRTTASKPSQLKALFTSSDDGPARPFGNQARAHHTTGQAVCNSHRVFILGRVSEHPCVLPVGAARQHQRCRARPETLRPYVQAWHRGPRRSGSSCVSGIPRTRRCTVVGSQSSSCSLQFRPSLRPSFKRHRYRSASGPEGVEEHAPPAGLDGDRPPGQPVRRVHNSPGSERSSER